MNHNNADFQLLDVRDCRDVAPPTPKQIAALWPGDSVLLQAGNTRFTVEILSRRKRHLFFGRATESTPLFAAGPELSFEARHVLETFRYHA